MKTFIIAELGSTWLYSKKPELNLQRGKKLIDLSANAGANAVKVQWVSSPYAMATRRNVLSKSYDHLHWPFTWHAILSDVAHAHGLEYISTVFLSEDVAKLKPYVDRYKVASLEFGDRRLRQVLTEQLKPAIYSTGACTLLDLTDFASKPYDCLLHCTAAYPCPPEQVNLKAMTQAGLVIMDGLSDHTGNVLTGAMAVAAGATMIEVHVRLDETPLNNPDYPHSLSPKQFHEYVLNIRLTERMLGSGEKTIQDGERPLLKHRVQQ